MKDILDRQRTAFMAELPVALEVRRDRLKRAIAMISDNADRLCCSGTKGFRVFDTRF